MSSRLVKLLYVSLLVRLSYIGLYILYTLCDTEVSEHLIYLQTHIVCVCMG